MPDGRDPSGKRFDNHVDNAIALPDHSTFLPAKFWINWYQVLQIEPESDSKLLILFLSFIFYRQNLVAEFNTWEQAVPDRLALVSTIYKTLPSPILFGSADDLYWLPEQVNSDTNPDRIKHHPQRHPKRRRRPRRNQQGGERICVRFKGKELKNHCFRINCDRRQLPVFKQFLADRETQKQRSKTEKFTGGVSTLRSAMLVWKKDTGRLQRRWIASASLLWIKFLFQIYRKDTLTENELDSWLTSFLCINTIFPWQSHRLYLHCTIDLRSLTAEGTEEILAEKTDAAMDRLDSLRAEVADLEQQAMTLIKTEEQQELQKEQARLRKTIKKNETTLARSKNPPIRPSRPSYKGESHIELVVTVSQFMIATATVVNTQTQEVLEFQNVKNLLTEHRADVLQKRLKKNQGKRRIEQLKYQQYRLIKRWRKQRKKNLLQRAEEQKRGFYNCGKQESNLSRHLNRLLAKRIVQLCHKHGAGIIVLPELGDIQESFECEIQARAKQKFPDDNVQLQKEYAKEVRMRFHRWNYKGLLKAICQSATNVRIPMTTRQQPKEGTLQDKAAAMATKI